MLLWAGRCISSKHKTHTSKTWFVKEVCKNQVGSSSGIQSLGLFWPDGSIRWMVRHLTKNIRIYSPGTLNIHNKFNVNSVHLTSTHLDINVKSTPLFWLKLGENWRWTYQTDTKELASPHFASVGAKKLHLSTTQNLLVRTFCSCMRVNNFPYQQEAVVCIW